MEFIDKKQSAQAHALIDGFLSRSKGLHGGKYVEDLYDNISADFCATGVKTKKQLLSLLMGEQENRCCYCMRNLAGLPAGDATIEHVIVNHPKDGEYPEYFGKGSTLDGAPITSTSDFLQKQVPPPPYPHSIAYENLLASCVGRLHVGLNTAVSCNNKRSHRYVAPLVLRANIHNEVEYHKNGEMLWTQETDTTNPSIDVRGLNDEFLKLIRRLWYKLASRNETPTNCNKTEVVYGVLGDMLDEGLSDAYAQKLFLFFDNSWYWGLLNQFDYFNDVQKFR